MPTSTRQILCGFIRADVGIRPYDADFNTAINYKLSVYLQLYRRGRVSRPAINLMKFSREPKRLLYDVAVCFRYCFYKARRGRRALQTKIVSQQ